MNTAQLLYLCQELQGNNPDATFDYKDLVAFASTKGITTYASMVLFKELEEKDKVIKLERNTYCINTYKCELIKHSDKLSALIHFKRYFLLKDKEVSFDMQIKIERDAYIEMKAYLDTCFYLNRSFPDTIDRTMKIILLPNESRPIAESVCKFMENPSASNYRNLQEKMVKYQDQINNAYLRREIAR